MPRLAPATRHALPASPEVHYGISPGVAPQRLRTIDPQRRARDKRSCGRRQEHDRGRDLFHRAGALERRLGHPALEQLRRILRRAARLDDAGRDRVDEDAELRPLDRERHREILDARARGAGVSHAGKAAIGIRGDVDDPAAVLDHPAIRDFAAHVERTDEVVLHDREKTIRRDQLRRRRELTARVVDQNVDAAEPGEHFADERLDLRGLADVARQREAIAAELLLRGVELGLRATADRELRAEPAELRGSGEPDARAAAGDDRDAVAQDPGGKDALALGGRRFHRPGPYSIAGPRRYSSSASGRPS